MGKFIAFSVIFLSLCLSLHASKDETDSEKKKFVPTDEWQVIPEGNKFQFFLHEIALIEYELFS